MLLWQYVNRLDHSDRYKTLKLVMSGTTCELCILCILLSQASLFYALWRLTSAHCNFWRDSMFSNSLLDGDGD